MKDSVVRKADLRDWPLPDNCLTALGRLAAAWSMLENSVDTYIGKLAGFNLDDPRSFILLRHSSFPQKLDMLAALCELLAPKYTWLSAYTSTITAIKEARSARSRFMHNPITFNADAKRLEIAVGSARGKIKTSVEVIQLEDIKRAAMLSEQALLALHALVTKKAYPPIWGGGAA